MVRWVMVAALCCAAGVAQAQEAVRVVKDSAMVAGCQRLTEVRGSSLMGGILASAGYDSALDEMKTKTVTAGGSHLLLFDLTSGQTGANGFGEAYRCEASAAPAQKPARKQR